LLRDVAIERAPRLLGEQAAPLVDDAVRGLIDQAVAEAYERGLHEGRRRGIAQVELAADLLRGALRDAAEELRVRHEAAAAETLDAAMEIAAFVLGRVPHEAEAFAHRLADLIEELAEERLRIAVNPADHRAVAGLAAALDMELTTDPNVAPGSARVVGSWVSAELGPEIAMEAVRRALS